MARTGNTAGLEGLAVGPYRWNAVMYSSFIRDVYDNVIKVEVERLQNIEMEKRKQTELTNSVNSTNGNQNYDTKVGRLVQRMINESEQVFGNQNWTDMIGPELWNILKLDEYGKDRYKLDNKNDDSAAFKKKSVVQLLKFIRNKISHIRTCKDEVKEKLSQFFDKDEKEHYQFNENKFVAFWISKFPKFVPYLWLKLYKFKEKLVNYYPDYEIEIGRLHNFLLDINKLEMEIKRAILGGMENGNVMKRFKGPGCSLEFRAFQNLVKTLDKNVFITVSVNSKDNVLFSVSHSSTNRDKLEYAGNAEGNEKLIIFFTDNISENKMWKYCTNCECKVIVFCDPDKLTTEKIEESVSKFKYENDLTVKLSESPISGIELSIEKQDWLFENGQVCIQGRDIKLKDIFIESGELIKELSGNLLNKLLKSEKPTICAKYKYPVYNGVYITRRLYLTNTNGKEKDKTLKMKLANEDFIYQKELAQDFRTKDMISMHSCTKCAPDQSKNTGIAGVLKESEFLRRINKNKMKSIYILAKTGMGKSKLLLSLGKLMKNSLLIFCSFRQFVDLMKKIDKNIEEFGKSDIKSVIFEILKCRDECERNLLSKWFERKGNKGAIIDLQLDGLDEVPSGNLKLVLKALEIIKKSFHAVRLWITSSKPLSAERELKFTYYSILPFSLRDKMNYFKVSCRVKGLPEEKIKGYGLLLGMRLMSEQDFVAFIDYPLNYAMLFELYEESLGNLVMLGGKGVSVEVFESHYQKKFAIMYRDKKGIKLDEDDDDFKMQRENYLQLYTHLALVHLFPTVSTKFVQPLGMQFFTKENCHKMGIITNNEPITFIHLKYADFFVARYVMKVLETGKVDVLCPEDLFLDMISFGTPEKENQVDRPSIWKFVEEYLENLSDWNSLKWLETHKKSGNTNRMTTDKNTVRFLITSFIGHLWNLAKLLINLWLDETDTDFCGKILFLALMSQPSTEWFISICEKLPFDNQYDLIICSVRHGQYEIAKYLIESKCGDDDNAFDKIAEKRENGGGILHCIVDHITHRHNSNTTFFDIVNETFENNAIEFIRFVLTRSPTETERTDSDGCNFLLALPVILKWSESNISSKHIFSLKEFLINELNADVNQLSFDGESVMCMELDMNYQHEKFCPCDCMFKNCKEMSDSTKVEIYHKTLAFVTSRNFVHINLKSKAGGLTPLEEAVHFFGSSLRQDTLEIFRACGASFNVLDGEGDTILHYCVKKCDDIEFIKVLVKYGCKINVQNGKGLCALCLAEKETKVEIRNFFRKMLKLKGKQKCPLSCAN